MKYFITYGDASFAEFRKQIVKEVEATKLFDKIIAYSHEDLGEDILSSKAFSFKKGSSTEARARAPPYRPPLPDSERRPLLKRAARPAAWPGQ